MSRAACQPATCVAYQPAKCVAYQPATCVAYQPAKCVAYQIAILVRVTYQPESAPLESRESGEETHHFDSMRTDIISGFFFQVTNQDRFEEKKIYMYMYNKSCCKNTYSKKSILAACDE